MTEDNKKEIYRALVDLLTIYCSTCLDKEQRQKMLLCSFKLELIEYAEKNDYTEEADEMWNSLARTLGLSFDGINYVKTSNKCNCANGVCELC